MELLEQIAKRISDHYRVISTGWIMLPCPIAEFTHADRDDKNYSFGISTSGGFHCFTCGAKGHIRQLPRVMAKYHRTYSYDLEDLVYEFANSIPEQSYEPQNEIKAEIPIQVYETYPIAKPCMGITKKDIEKWGIRQVGDTLIFPLFSTDKTKLYGVKCRKINTHLFWYIGAPAKRDGIWFGMWFKPNGHLALVEGERDAIMLGRALTSWASIGAPTMAQMEAIAQLPKDVKIILAFDNDRAGRDMCTFASEIILDRTLYRLDLGKYKDPAEMIEAGVKKLNIKKWR